MTTQLLIYKTAVPVSATRHGDAFMEPSEDFSFSGEVNSVPLMAVEFPNASAEYPIVFAGSGADILPAVMLGLRGNENLFLAHGREWGGRYIPAFLRRYPFVFSKDGDRLVLCVDEEFPGFNRVGRGQKLFGADGQPTPYVQQVMTFMQEFQAQSVVTHAFCQRLRALDLLEPMQANVVQSSGAKLAMTGFMAVSRAKLKALPGQTLAELAASDQLELLYLHLHSMRNFDALKDRLEAQTAAADPAPPGQVH